MRLSCSIDKGKRDQEVFFCGKCGTYVWSRYGRAPGDTLFVRAGTLDNARAITPDVHIFTRSKGPMAEPSGRGEGVQDLLQHAKDAVGRESRAPSSQ